MIFQEKGANFSYLTYPPFWISLVSSRILVKYPPTGNPTNKKGVAQDVGCADIKTSHRNSVQTPVNRIFIACQSCMSILCIVTHFGQILLHMQFLHAKSNILTPTKLSMTFFWEFQTWPCTNINFLTGQFSHELVKFYCCHNTCRC